MTPDWICNKCWQVMFVEITQEGFTVKLTVCSNCGKGREV